MFPRSPRPCTAGCFCKVTCAFLALIFILFYSSFSQATISILEQPPQGTVGISYNTMLTVIGGTAPYSFSCSGLPAGLTLSRTTGSITGVPLTAGTYAVKVTVTDATSNQGQASFSILVATTGTISV